MIWPNTYRFTFILMLAFVQYGAMGQKEPLYFESYTTENGLPQNLVGQIVQDKTGFIWLTTNDGLSRFDGYKFDNFKYKINDTNSLPADFLTDIVVDDNNGLWISTFGKGLTYYDQKQNHFFRFNAEKDSLSYRFKNILSLYIDKSNRLWIGTSDAIYCSKKEIGILVQNKSGFSNYFIEYQPIGAKQKIQTIYQDGDDEIWLGAEEGLFLIDHKKGSYAKVNFNNQVLKVNDIKALTKDFLLIATDKGLFKFNKNTKTSTNILETELFSAYRNTLKIDQLLFDKDGNLWIATYGAGLLYYKPKTKEVVQYISNRYDEHSLRSDMVSALYIDKANTLFVGLRGKGLNVAKIRKNHFSRFRKNSDKKSISNNIVWNIYSISDKEVWVCTHNGLNKFMPRNGGFEQYFIGDKGNKDGSTFVRMAKKSETTFYLSSLGNGLVEFNRKTRSFKKLMSDGANNYDANYISGFCKKNDTSIIVSFYGKNLAEYKLNGKRLRTLTDTINNYIRILYKDNQNRLWIGSWGSGLYLYHPDNDSFEVFSTKEGLNSDYIFYIYQDTDGYLWIGTSSGLTRFNPKTKKVEAQEWQSAFDEEVYSILEDDKKNLWVGTNNGLFKINKTNGKWLNFNVWDGLQSNEFNTAACAKTPDGHMVFGGINGLNYFHPDSIRLCTYKPQIVITNFSLFYKEYKKGDKLNARVILSKPIEFTDSIILKYNENVLELNFTALDYFESSEIKYAYRLVGFEDKWIETGAKKRLAMYTNLKPGNYIFQIKSTNSDGVWNDKIKHLHIIIQPALWQTVWFKIISTAIVLMLFTLFYKLRLRNLKKQKAYLEQLVNQKTAELEQSMNTLLEQKKELSETNSLLEEKHEEVIQQSEELRIISEKLKVSNLDLELKVKKRTKKLNRALDDSKKAEKLIASFLSNMSHEIRTPMNAISGFSQLIAQTDISDEQREHYNSIISQSVDSLLEQIDNIMHVSKMHSGTYVMKNNIFSLNTLFNELFTDFNSRKELQKPNVLLRWQYPETPNNITLFADKQVFKQIVHQLVSNALKYTEKGEVVFGCQLQQIVQNKTTVYKIADKKTQTHEAVLIIFVKDTGVGIDKKQQQYIFDAFKKIEGKEKLFRGTGLGLAIVKNLCNSINAKIELKSELNKGSIFTIKLALLNN